MYIICIEVDGFQDQCFLSPAYNRIYDMYRLPSVYTYSVCVYLYMSVTYCIAVRENLYPENDPL